MRAASQSSGGVGAGTQKRAKKEEEPPLREHGFGDLSKFGVPPKNPASSFMQFSRVYRAGKERGKAPNARHVSETWNQMTEEQKRPFVELAEEDKRRVQTEIEAYMAQYPEQLKNMEDYKMLVSILREREKRDKDVRRVHQQGVGGSADEEEMLEEEQH